MKTLNSFTTKSGKEMEDLGKVFSKKLSGGDAVLLFGGLGAGKTTFVKGVAKGLGIRSRIVSPTFVLVRQHKVKSGLFLYHVDLYRIEREKSIQELGLAEFLEDPNAIVVIEWAERLVSKPQKRWEIYMAHLGEEEREVRIEKYG